MVVVVVVVTNNCVFTDDGELEVVLTALTKKREEKDFPEKYVVVREKILFI